MTACPQLVYTSASRTLEGPGFGVFAMSRNWPRSLGTSRSTLGSLIGQPPDGEAYGVLSLAGGRLAYRKVTLAADDFGRSGNYVVQLLWDGDGSLTARDVLAMRGADVFLSRLAPGAEPSRDAPPVQVPCAHRAAPSSLGVDDVDALVPSLAALLAAVESGGGTVGLPAASVLFDVMPRGLAADLSVHVGTADTMGDAAAVQALVGRYAEPSADPANSARALARCWRRPPRASCARTTSPASTNWTPGCSPTRGWSSIPPR